MEHQHLEGTSLKLVMGKDPDWDALARECVCFANAHGGRLLLGVEDDGRVPPDQRIPAALPERVSKEIPRTRYRRQLAALVREGDLVLMGERRGARYSLADPESKSLETPHP